MIITISGSMQFFQQMHVLAEQLEGVGDTIFMPVPSSADRSGHVSQAQKTLHMKEHVDFIRKSDALLVANYDKNNIANYIGGNTFLEMGAAFAFNKPIYLLAPIPDVGFTDEIQGLEPVILHGNLDGIRRTT